MNKVELLIISIGIFLTIIAWLIIDIYHVQIGGNNKMELSTVTIKQFQINKIPFEDLKLKQ